MGCRSDHCLGPNFRAEFSLLYIGSTDNRTDAKRATFKAYLIRMTYVLTQVIPKSSSKPFVKSKDSELGLIAKLPPC